MVLIGEIMQLEFFDKKREKPQIGDFADVRLLGKIKLKNGKLEFFDRTIYSKNIGVCYFIVLNGEIKRVGETTRSFINRFYEYNKDHDYFSILREIKNNHDNDVFDVYGYICEKRVIEFLGEKTEEWIISPRRMEKIILKKLKKLGKFPEWNKQK
jgi:hypothetical protein